MAKQGEKRERLTWDASRVQALRRHLGMTQEQLAEELGTRQQTISEWETGLHRPRGASRTVLSIIAERAAFYDPAGGQDAYKKVEEKE